MRLLANNLGMIFLTDCASSMTSPDVEVLRFFFHRCDETVSHVGRVSMATRSDVKRQKLISIVSDFAAGELDCWWTAPSEHFVPLIDETHTSNFFAQNKAERNFLV
jgi:hypothetical protein